MGIAILWFSKAIFGSYEFKNSSLKNLLFNILLIYLMLSCKKDEHTNLIYQTNFDTDDNTWGETCDTQYCFKYDQGKYDVDVYIPNVSVWAYAPCGILNTTYSLSVDCTIQLTDVTKFGGAGFVYNWIDDTNYKVFLISSNGEFEILEKNGSNLNTMNSWAASTAIKTGNGVVNTLNLKQSASSIEFLVNGISLGVFQYSQSFNFKVALTVSSGATSSEFTPIATSFDNLVIEKLP